ncbi:MAG: hypothetical protein ACJAUC_004688 [Planctomycetota bacterium]|jgi:hypothetical protein
MVPSYAKQCGHFCRSIAATRKLFVWLALSRCPLV